jgi:hypothetical protein
MWHHFVNLMGHSWDSFLRAMGTTGLGFITPVLVFALTIIVTLFVIYFREGRDAMRQHWKETAAITATVTLGVMLLVYGPILFWNVVKTTYDDHESLVEKNKELLDKNKELAAKNKALEPEHTTAPPRGAKHQLGGQQPNSGAQPPQYPSSAPMPAITGEPSEAAEDFITKSFSEFNAAIDQGKPCLIKITAPEDSLRGAQKVARLAREVLRNVSKCAVTGPSRYDSNPDIEKQDLTGTIPGKVLVRAAKDQKGMDKFFEQFNFYVDSKRSYDIPEGTKGNYLWLQFGGGIRWR